MVIGDNHLVPVHCATAPVPLPATQNFVDVQLTAVAGTLSRNIVNHLTDFPFHTHDLPS